MTTMKQMQAAAKWDTGFAKPESEPPVAGAAPCSAWTRNLPTESGAYWWWNEDEDSAPIHIEIMYSGTDGSYFAPAGQYGWTRFQPVAEMGGWWMRLHEPETPNQKALRRRAKRTRDMIQPTTSANAESVGLRTSEAPFAAAAGYAAKPPLGIIPRKLCVEKRLHEIVEAIGRYHKGHYIIPVEWFEEAAEIGRWLERHTDPSSATAATRRPD